MWIPTRNSIFYSYKFHDGWIRRWQCRMGLYQKGCCPHRTNHTHQQYLYITKSKPLPKRVSNQYLPLVLCLVSTLIFTKPGVNFTNILRDAFSYKSIVCSFSLFTVKLCNILAEEISSQKVLVKCGWNWLLENFGFNFTCLLNIKILLHF